MHEIRTSILSGVEKPATPIARKTKPKAEAASLCGLTKIAIKRTEARITNQRSEDRLRDVVEESTMVFRRRKYQVRVINVSSRGAMIESDLDARIGERIDVLFSEQNKTRCIVRWVREGRIGLEFAEETIFWDQSRGNAPVFQYAKGAAAAEKPAAPVREITEREKRHTLLRSGTLYWSGISIPVRLKNISEGGARVESEQALRPGAEVELDLGEAGFQYAEVRWARDGQIGLRFAADFDLDSLAPAAATASTGHEVLKPAYLETETQADSPWAARFERLSLTDLKSPQSF
jgi:hypothetical protein